MSGEVEHGFLQWLPKQLLCSVSYSGARDENSDQFSTDLIHSLHFKADRAAIDMKKGIPILNCLLI